MKCEKPQTSRLEDVYSTRASCWQSELSNFNQPLILCCETEVVTDPVLQSRELCLRLAASLSRFLTAHPIMHPTCLGVDSL